MTPERIEALKKSAENAGPYIAFTASVVLECLSEIELLTAENLELRKDHLTGDELGKLNDKVLQLEAENASIQAELSKATEWKDTYRKIHEKSIQEVIDLKAENAELKKHTDCQRGECPYYDKLNSEIRRLQALPQPEARPTPSSALTKALEEFVSSLISLRDNRYMVPKEQVEKLESIIEALRASPGGEGGEEVDSDVKRWDVHQHKALDGSIAFGEMDTFRYGRFVLFKDYLKAIEQAEIRGAEWALETIKNKIKRNYQNGYASAPDALHAIKYLEAAAIVASHKSPAPEKGRTT